MKEIFDVKAASSLRIVAKLLPGVEDDQEVNEIAYNVQQATERLLKHIICSGGCFYPSTHRVGDLVRVIHKHELVTSDNEDFISFCDTNSAIITEWESETRYNENYFAKYSQVVSAFHFLEKSFTSVCKADYKHYKRTTEYLKESKNSKLRKFHLE